MERLLHYVWKYKLFTSAPLKTTQGLSVQIIDTGIHNQDAGPDFFNAKIRIGETLWIGNIEIHHKSSDWYIHGHHTDKLYDTVILHVVNDANKEVCRLSGEPIPQLELQPSDSLKKSFDWLDAREKPFPCYSFLSRLDPLYISNWMTALLSERIERKIKDIDILLEQYNNDWNEVFYIILTRNFGFGVNSDAFEWLAKSIPFRCIQKQRSSHSQIESLFFGQAGLLQSPSEDHYYRLLQQEYRFLRHKYGLAAPDYAHLRSLRIRPHSFPYLKIAQLAAIWEHYDTLFSVILETTDIKDIKNLFRLPPSPYWDTHYNFSHSSAKKEKLMGDSSLSILLINTVIPMLFAYGVRSKKPEYCDRAIQLIEKLPPEQNSIVKSFAMAGVAARHAGDSQSLIQLRRAYCETRKCLYCRWGFQLLKQGLITPFS